MNDTSYIKHSILNEICVTDLITIHYFEYGKKYYYGESHDFWEIMYTDRGEVMVTCGNEEYCLQQGQLILLPPNVFHALSTCDEKLANVFIISFVEAGNSLNKIGGRILSATDSVKSLIRALIRESAKTFILPMSRIDRRCLRRREDIAFGAEQIIKMRLEELLILLYRNENAQESEGGSKARYDDYIAGKIMEFLKDNIYNQITLSEVTSSLGYGKTYVSNIFKRVYGRGIMECYTLLKMEEAKHLLREGKMTVSQIAECLCFSSPQFFSKRFTQITNMSPRQYASSVREDWTTTPELQQKE